MRWPSDLRRGALLALIPAVGLLCGAESPPRPESVIRSRPVSIHDTSLAQRRQGENVCFELFDDRTVVGTVLRRRDRSPGRLTLSGSLEGGGTFVVALNRGSVAGVIQEADGTTYRIRASGLLEQLDAGGAFRCLTGDVPPPAPRRAGNAPTASGPCDDGSVIDVLFVYTQAAVVAAGGVASLEAEIDLAVEYNNVAYDHSLVETEWNQVFAWSLGPGEDPSLAELTDPADGVVDGVHDLRDAYGADQVALIDSGGGGVANGMDSFDPEEEAEAFCKNGLNAMPFVVAHEIGHNMGCCHAINDGGGCPPEGGLLFEFSNGRRFIGDSLETWRTIMAYTPGTLIQHFSNPDVLFDGEPTGLPGKSLGDADNALTINLSKLTVSNWRCNDGICEALDLPSNGPDCNDNEIPDLCDIARGASMDVDGNGVPDECECPDFDGDGAVSTADLLELLGAWGPNPGHRADLDGDGIVSSADLLELLAKWGPCP